MLRAFLFLLVASCFAGCFVLSPRPIQEEGGTFVFYENNAYFSFPAKKVKEIKVITVVAGTQKEYQISKIEGEGPLFSLVDTTEYWGEVVITTVWNEKGFDSFIKISKPKSKHAIIRIKTFNSPKTIFVSGIKWSYAYRGSSGSK